MNIVWLTPEIPYPPIGGRNGVYNRIVQLSKCNDIFLISIAYNQNEKNNTIEMEKYCKEVHYYDRSTSKCSTLLKCIVYPYSIASRFRMEIVKKIESIINENSIDLIIIDFPNMAKNVSALKKKYPDIKITLNEHNIEYVRMRELFHVKSISIVKRFAYWLESYRLEHYERKLYKSNLINGITFFSEDDKLFFEKNIDTGKSVLDIIPLGANDFNEQPLIDKKNTLLFVGRLDHIAVTNVEAITWFLNDIWPKVKEEVPESKLILAGSNPEEDVLKFANEKDVTIIPNFKNMKEVYDLTNIVILPLLSGGGVKGKLLEAVAFRKHIVTTQHGIEGTLFEDKKHVSLCNCAEDFSNACIELLKKPDAFNTREQSAYNLFIDKYEWKSIGKEYMKFLEGL